MTTRARRALLGAFLGAALAGPAVADGLSGAYLAAMQADFRNDYAAAADYYSRALELDPGNAALLQNTVVANVAIGDMEQAVPLAAELAEGMPANQIATLVRLAEASRAGDWAVAAEIVANPTLELNPLLAGLVGGWAAVGAEDFAAATERFEAMTANEALAAYGQYHKALALALAGDFVTAAEILEGEGEPLHLDRTAIVAHAEILAQIDRGDEALAVLDEALATGIPDPVLIDLRTRIAAGQVPFSVVRSAADGAALAFRTLAVALNTADSDRFALLYARLSLHIRPDDPDTALVVADVLEAHGQYGLATEALAAVPADSPLSVAAEIRRAGALTADGDAPGGIAALQALAADHPGVIEVQSALGDALREAERYAEAAEAYTAAIDLVAAPQRVHWPLFYTRGIAHERAGRFDLAEADFRRALELEPDQPLVLNYLGYSLVEERRNYDEALAMIEAAVAGQPDDGYITDSLGWVLYRLGRYEEAAPPMLRAVELVPEDAVINDHLGDVLWMVGRKREAEFQWRRALSLGPAEDLDMDRIRAKLERGLDEVLAEEGAEEETETPTDG